jgi:hypothetical protein
MPRRIIQASARTQTGCFCDCEHGVNAIADTKSPRVCLTASARRGSLTAPSLSLVSLVLLSELLLLDFTPS